jgi:hypothetical protein
MKLLLSVPSDWLLIAVIVLAFVTGLGIGRLIIKKKRSRF